MKKALVKGRELAYHINPLLQEAKIHACAGVAELADAYGSGPYGGNPVKVQVLSPAP